MVESLLRMIILPHSCRSSLWQCGNETSAVENFALANYAWHATNQQASNGCRQGRSCQSFPRQRALSLAPAVVSYGSTDEATLWRDVCGGKLCANDNFEALLSQFAVAMRQ